MFLKKVDFLSADITLYYKGQDHHASILSGILSILMGVFIIFLIGYLSIDVIKKQNPTSFYFTKYIEEIDNYPLNSSSLFHYISLVNYNGVEMEIDPKAISVIGVNANDGLYVEDNDLSKYSYWIYEYCEVSDLGDLKQYYTSSQIDNLTNSVCISKYYNKDTNSLKSKNDEDFEWPTLVHGASQFNNFEYGIYIQRCQNNSIVNNNNCYSKSKQDEFIANAHAYAIYFIDHYVDVEQYKKPIINSIHRVSNELNSDSFTLNHLNFHPLIVRTNDALFFDNLKSQVSYNFDYNEKITQSVTDYNILGGFYFWMQNTIDTYDRAYKKIQDVAGGIDGILEIAMLIVKFVNYFFFNNYQELIDFNEELNKNENSKKILKSNKSIFTSNDNQKNNLRKKSKNLDDQIVSASRNIGSKSFVKRNHPFITNGDNNSISISKVNNTNIINKEKKPKKLKWIHYITTMSLLRKYSYIEKLQDKREEFISEEKIIEMILMIESIQKTLKKDTNNYNNTLVTEYERLETLNNENINNIDNYNNNNNNNNGNMVYTSSPLPLLLNK